MIELVDVAKSYAGARVLAGVSLRFTPGAVTCVLGPSGSGKSTLLRCINGLESIDDGEVRVGDAVLRPRHATAHGRDQRRALFAIRQRVGFVFQQWNLFQHRTALGNVIEAPIHVKKVPAAEALARGRALLEKVGLAHRASAYPHEMSGGEQQRVAIARALAMDPEALLLDEPTSALDPSLCAEVQSVLRRLASEGTTMILVTHDVRFAREVSAHAVVLHGGILVERGAAADVLTRPQDARTRAFLAHFATEIADRGERS